MVNKATGGMHAATSTGKDVHAKQASGEVEVKDKPSQKRASVGLSLSCRSAERRRRTGAASQAKPSQAKPSQIKPNQAK